MTISLAFLAPDLVKAAIEDAFHMAWELSASPTCLPNGPASTRCSGFPPNSCPFEPSLCRLRSPLPGNGISGAEKKAPIRRPNTDQRSQRPSGRTRSPPIRAFANTARNSPQPDCVVVDAVPYELVSAAKFPDIREFTGNFLQFTG